MPEHLKCPITGSLCRNAVVLPCCGASVSNDALHLALREDEHGVARGATCALCRTAGVFAGDVVPNRQLRGWVEAFERKA